MRRGILVALLFVGLYAAMPQSPFAQSGLTDGQVTKVDPSAKKITLRHGPMKKLNMEEPMTMVYAVKDPDMLKQVKAGDKIKFDADRVNGQLTITTIQKGN